MTYQVCFTNFTCPIQNLEVRVKDFIGFTERLKQSGYNTGLGTIKDLIATHILNNLYLNGTTVYKKKTPIKHIYEYINSALLEDYWQDCSKSFLKSGNLLFLTCLLKAKL